LPKASGKRVVVLLHGLEGDTKRPYMLGSARALSNAGFDVCAVNMRGCSGMPNRLYRSYHSGATDDLMSVLAYLDNTRNYDQVFLKGFSLGANLILKYLGDHPEANERITAAVAVSAPCDLHDCLVQLSMPKNRIYSNRFLLSLRAKLKIKQSLYPELLSDDLIERVKTLKDFDDIYTSKAHGFIDAMDYYRNCSSLPVLPSITVPTLLLNAKNDSFLGENCYPHQIGQSNSALFFEPPEFGGHVGFYLRGNLYYNESRTLDFFNNYI
jgi:predicted alpha/beta-fold hydrolase